MPLKPSAIDEQEGQPAVKSGQHEVVDEELRSFRKKVCQRGASLVVFPGSVRDTQAGCTPSAAA